MGWMARHVVKVEVRCKVDDAAGRWMAWLRLCRDILLTSCLSKHFPQGHPASTLLLELDFFSNEVVTSLSFAPLLFRLFPRVVLLRISPPQTKYFSLTSIKASPTHFFSLTLLLLLLPHSSFTPSYSPKHIFCRTFPAFLCL